MNSVRVSLGHCAQFWENLGGEVCTEPKRVFLILYRGHFQKRNQEVVPETCAEDLKTDISSQDST